MRRKRGAIAECGSIDCIGILLNLQDNKLKALRAAADSKWNATRGVVGVEFANALNAYGEAWDAWYEQYKHLYAIRHRLHGDAETEELREVQPVLHDHGRSRAKKAAR